MQTELLGGSKYFKLLITNDFNRMSWLYFLKLKSQAFECFKKFMALVENQSNSKIKALRTDKGESSCPVSTSTSMKSTGLREN